MKAKRRRLLIASLASRVAGLSAPRVAGLSAPRVAGVFGTAPVATYAATPAPAPADDNWYPPVEAGYRLVFPRDHGAHPMFRTEWWYLTAWIDMPGGPSGIQLTFFRSRTRHSQNNPSRFAPTQLMFGHAAIALPGSNGLLHAQLAARASQSMIATADTALQMTGDNGDWQLSRQSDDSYRAAVNTRDFSFSLRAQPSFAPVLQGDRGFSRKGVQPRQASYYYSRPQLAVTGSLSIVGSPTRRIERGTAWLDHEWSSELLDSEAVGWDWVGLNLQDNEALMAFRIRAADGSTRYAHARWIRNGRAAPAPPPRFIEQRRWRSPATNIAYPVEMDIQVGDRRIRLTPLLDNQELDTRRSTGTVYWEGAVQASDAATGRSIGRGYLELTGYAGKVRF